jgi:hypothetical protein
LDFKPILEKIGKIFVQGLSKRMKQQKGIDNNTYSSPAPSTLKARKSLKGKAASSSVKRLVVTNELSNNAFSFKAFKDRVAIYAREASHLGGISYARIIEYNSKGQSRVNPKIVNPPLVFPTNSAEVGMMDNEIKIARNIFAKEALAKLKEEAKMNIKQRLAF